jgi:preprotein translocase subunit SecF
VNIIKRRRIWYAISLIVIVPGVISLVLYGLKLGIDFKGGSMMEIEGKISAAQVRQSAVTLGFHDLTVTPSGGDRSLIRYRDDSPPSAQESHHQQFKARLAELDARELRFDTVGPSISRDITRNAIISVALASLAIVLFIAYAFRNVPPSVSPWSFGTMAVVALLHDALFVLGLFSILGRFFGVEIDSLFVTALLTVIGFSVHDTIVVFDRIRENLRRHKGSFEDVVNMSILETLGRSINTSLTVLLTLLALYLFGGESIRLFVLALLVGIASGTYSSIFNASPLLVTWQNFQAKRIRKS